MFAVFQADTKRPLAKEHLKRAVMEGAKAEAHLFQTTVGIPGGGGDSHMEQTGMLVGKFEFNP